MTCVSTNTTTTMPQSIITTKTNSSQEVEQLVLKTIAASERGLTTTELVERLQINRKLLGKTLSALFVRGAIESVGDAGAKRYRLPNQVAAPRTITRTYGEGTYLGIELQRTPGIPASRYEAFALPSRIADRLHYPCGKVTRVCGSAA